MRWGDCKMAGFSSVRWHGFLLVFLLFLRYDNKDMVKRAPINGERVLWKTAKEIEI